MTKGEVAKLLAVLAASYPKFEVDDLKVHVWHEMLSDIDYSIASTAIKKLIMQNTFPPSIAEVRKAVTELMNPEQVTSSEAWGEVIRAMHNFGYYREEEALASMSPTTARVVRYMGWREICMSEEPAGVLRGQFLKMYEQVTEREQKETLLPERLKDDIKMLSERFTLPAEKEAKALQEGKRKVNDNIRYISDKMSF